jgi:hypothetical protein
MRRIGSLSLVFLIAIASPQPQSTPSISFSPARSTFLSTESASGHVVVTNTLPVEISFLPAFVTYLIRDGSGQVHEEPRIRTIGHLVAPTSVAAGATYSFDIPLPDCDVISDPCTMHVALEYFIGAQDGRSFKVQSAEKTYTFVPDPTATFRVDGLVGNRPLLMVPGTASGPLLQIQPVIRLHFVRSAPDNLDDIVNAATSSFSLKVDSSGTEGDWSVYLLASKQDKALPDFHAAGRVVDELQRRLGSQADAITLQFQPGGDDIHSYIDSAQRDARAEATGLAAYLGVSGLSDASGLDGDPTIVKFYSSAYGAWRAQWFSYSQIGSDPSALAAERGSAPGTILIDTKTLGVYGADQTIPGTNIKVVKFPTNEYPASSQLLPFSLQAQIAADRPELFVLAGAAEQESEKEGYFADAVALRAARERLRLFARVLGVGVGYLSLVIRYDDASMTTNTTVVSYGIGATMTGEPTAIWRNVAKRFSSTAAPLMAQPVPMPIPTSGPLLGPMPMPITNFRAFQAVESLSNGEIWLMNFPLLAPIDAPDPSTLVRSFGDVSVTARADAVRVRLSVASDASPPSGGAPDPLSVEDMLLEHPFVLSAAIEDDSRTHLPVSYEFIAKTGDAGQINHLIDQIRRLYNPLAGTIQIATSAVSSDCAPFIAQSQSLSYAQATRLAVREAKGSNRSLRHLLLAVAYPIRAGDACYPVAYDDSLIPNVGKLQMPDAAVTIDSPVLLMFRTTTAAH